MVDWIIFGDIGEMGIGYSIVDMGGLLCLE
jgi:hypothetical protein